MPAGGTVVAYLRWDGQHSARTDLDLPGRGPEQVRWTKGLTVTGRVERIDMRGTERAATRVKAMMIEC